MATFDLAARIDAHSEAANELHSQYSDAVGLGGRAASLADRANQSVTLASDLESINEMVLRLVSDLTRDAIRLKAASLEPLVGPDELDRMGREATKRHDRWVGYIEHRVGAAAAMYEALD